MIKTALLVVYNHRYDKNIEKIEQIYKGRFSHVFHLMPFYRGERENVLPVYESSLCFQSYIAQAYQQIKHLGFTHYFVIADDMIINPSINDRNLHSFINIPESHCFITNIRNVFTSNAYWHHMYKAFNYNPYPRGVEIKNILPSYLEAEKKLKEKGYQIPKVGFISMIKAFLWFAKKKRKSAIVPAFKAIFKSKRFKYPLVAGWSDILLLTSDVMERFCQYCGAFAATDLFVELAIPTALVLSADKISTSTDLSLKYIHLIYQLPEEEQKKFYDRYSYSLSSLISGFPENMFFIHPVKLSQWEL